MNLHKRLQKAFPEFVTPEGFDWCAFRQQMDAVMGTEATYGLQWVGKSMLQQAETLQPMVPFVPSQTRTIAGEGIQHAFFEADNLDALHFLAQQHPASVKAIYIDPPYNTGKAFIYGDNYAQGRGSTRCQHSAWLSMMYPRLQLAKTLLRDDGIVFLSIDHHEAANLQLLCNEIFGIENHVALIPWVHNLKGRQMGSMPLAYTHEVILCYAKSITQLSPLMVSPSRMTAEMPSVYRMPKYKVHTDAKGSYVLKNQIYNSNRRFNEETCPNLVYDIYYHTRQKTVRVEDVSDEHLHKGWRKIPPHRNGDGVHRYHANRWSRAKVLAEQEDLAFVKKGDQYQVWTKIRDWDQTAFKDLIMDIPTQSGMKDIEALGFPKRIFDYPKPVRLIEVLLRTCTQGDDVVLDFFAGSSSTAHAVLRLNQEDGGQRRFIMMQAPIAIDDEHVAKTQGFDMISELSIERIRRVLQQQEIPDSVEVFIPTGDSIENS